MRQVADLLIVGSTADVRWEQRPLLSACQTIHYRRNGWTRQNRPPKTDPGYILKDDDGWLTLNWVDGPADLYEHGGEQTWRHAFGFLDRAAGRNMAALVHCDQGVSRAPTLALAWMCHARLLPLDPDSAADAFRTVYPEWRPGGIWEWLRQHWPVVLSG